MDKLAIINRISELEEYRKQANDSFDKKWSRACDKQKKQNDACQEKIDELTQEFNAREEKLFLETNEHVYQVYKWRFRDWECLCIYKATRKFSSLKNISARKLANARIISRERFIIELNGCI